ncbi:MAG: FixH family protein [Lentilitoribacter sp.]
MIKAVKSFVAPTEFTGWHMFTIICIFFGTIITVNMILAFNAGSTWTGLVVKNTYVASQIFNEETEKLEQQRALGWSSDLNYTDAQLRLKLTDNNGALISGANVSAKIGNPVHETNDHMVSFTQIGEFYVVENNLENGLWQIDLQVQTQDGLTWNKAVRLVVGG